MMSLVKAAVNTCGRRIYLGLACAMTCLLCACSAGKLSQATRQLDLGAGPGVMNKMALPRNAPVVVPEATASALLVDTAVIWRVGHAGQPQAYATFQWAAPPARLVNQRLIERLSLQGAVLPQNVGGDLPQIRLNLQRFEQFFAADGSSSVGALTLQAVLVKDGKVLDQRLVDIQVPAATQDAPGGADALRRATDQATEQVAKWASEQLKP